MNNPVLFLNNNNINPNNAINQNSLLILSPQNSFLVNNNQAIPIIATIQPLNNNFKSLNKSGVILVIKYVIKNVKELKRDGLLLHMVVI